MKNLLPVFLNLSGRPVLLVGGGRVAAAKLAQLLAVGAKVRVVAPHISPSIVRTGVEVVERAFVPADLEGAWLVVSAATPDVNREVAAAAEAQQVFVNAVDDPANATAFLSGVVRRDGITLAISTGGEAPALTSLLREALDSELPEDLAVWMALARAERARWRRDRVAMNDRKPRLLHALNEIYAADRAPDLSPAPEVVQDSRSGFTTSFTGPVREQPHPVLTPRALATRVGLRAGRGGPVRGHPRAGDETDSSPAVPWLNGPEDSWL